MADEVGEKMKVDLSKLQWSKEPKHYTGEELAIIHGYDVEIDYTSDSYYADNKEYTRVGRIKLTDIRELGIGRVSELMEAGFIIEVVE